jgi:hypothetical protein
MQHMQQLLNNNKHWAGTLPDNTIQMEKKTVRNGDWSQCASSSWPHHHWQWPVRCVSQASSKQHKKDIQLPTVTESTAFSHLFNIGRPQPRCEPSSSSQCAWQSWLHHDDWATFRSDFKPQDLIKQPISNTF